MDVEKIKFWLQKFTLPKNLDLNNYDIIIERRTMVEPNVFAYRCAFQTIYLTRDCTPVTMGKQHIIGNKYYYDFCDDNLDGDGQYTYICDIMKGDSDE